MAKLTEEMVVARARNSDLSKVQKLNCWGSDLSDVSLIRKMRSVEVLALSVNNISSLADFEDCEQLKELYLRKNNIQDISELAYLQNLPNLRNLWLEENPCVERAGPNYRMIVLRALPALTKLDNVDVTPEEVNEAMRQGVRREEPVYEEQYNEPQQPQQQPARQHAHQDHRQTSPMRDAQAQQIFNVSSDINTEESSMSEVLEEPSSPLQNSPPGQYSLAPQQQLVNNSNRANSFPSPTTSSQQPQQRLQRTPSNGHSSFDVRMRSPGSDYEGSNAAPIANNITNMNPAGFRERGTLQSSISTQSMKEYYQSEYQRSNGNNQYRHSQQDLTWDEQHENGGRPGHGGGERPSRRSNVGGPTDRDVPGSYGNNNGYGRGGGGSGQPRDDWEDEKTDRNRRMSSAHQEHRRSESRFPEPGVSNAVLNHYASLHRRPTHRNSNILSAVLCLVNELDAPGLEVVEHAIRCRLNEVQEM